ncbi:lantibiotic dehydratase [Streptomyces huiliensis]|uniref:lantibiotic dehydratase n=1 Tax=Streptomyces huiliensis TaxID=2876027 RepID=UPI001CBBE380|nr:lantibiotic dehydratase [Streptomyces huiliensis]MBZ4319929.1 lantibiotic dehydratase family protein [Streptomyces huiliensis]
MTPTAPQDAPLFRMLDPFVLRRAGFGIGLLDGLDCPGTASALQAAREHAARAETARARLLDDLVPAEVARLRAAGDRDGLRALSALRSRIGRRRVRALPEGPWPAGLADGYREWTDAVAAAARDTARADELLLREEQSTAERLFAATARQDVREALFLLSPGFLDSLVRHDRQPAPPGGGTASERALQRRAYAFLQRLGAKNETTSFFGPVCFGSVDPEAKTVGHGPETPTGVVRRGAFVSFWAAAAWGRAAAAIPAVRRRLPPRRIAAVVLEGSRAALPGRPPVDLEPADLALLRSVDGTRTAAELAAATGLAHPETESRITALERNLLVRRDLEPGSTTLHPFQDVVSRLPDVPEAQPFRTAAADLSALVERFAAETGVPERTKILAEAEALFESVTRVPARRNQGRTYADRFILFEDCWADGQPVRWPPALARRIERALDPVFRLGLTAGHLRREGLRGIAAGLLAEHDGSLPFLRFAELLAARLDEGALLPVRQKHERWRSALLDRFLAASDGRVAALPPDAVADLADAPDGRFFVSPDVMLPADPAAPLVLGEIHPYMFAWGLQGHFAPDADHLARAVRPALDVWGGPARAATVLHRRQHKGLVGDAYPGRFIEVTGRAGTGPGRRAMAGELTAALVDGEPVLLGPDGPLELYVGEEDHAHLRVFAPVPVEFPRLAAGEHTPRLVLGDVVVQRERWDLPAGALPELDRATDRAALFRAVVTERARRGWPRHVFALSPTETKPMYLDLDVPQAQEHLRSLAAAGPLAVTEMLPGPDELSLHRSTGAFTSEYRIAMVAGTGPSS